MADTYSQIYIHIVFAVKGRDNLIWKRWKEEVHKYIKGIITNEGQKLIEINSMPDHVHILIGLKPTVVLSNLVRDIKANSSKFINDQKWIAGKFEWQQGFGAFSCSHSQLTKVISYIKNQEEHHKTKTFREEYIEFLEAYNIDFKNEFIFDNV
ncbi:transposase [Flavobacterium rivuli WB 3.3-2 = DSM 21788]|uniref:Transposase n=1 Tax=Flavobacterium rivuli WB 3.3-2 = DSM 21788 TaxID=1121895 RepID=A0A0A2MBP3_9FLAO|nr:IS200/IS605 family transposase [Flavobacterium rivuli]KGO85675.1 transposase [Flavobacterium rivuli WB 3.3-2 = DSM 21788]